MIVRSKKVCREQMYVFDTELGTKKRDGVGEGEDNKGAKTRQNGRVEGNNNVRFHALLVVGVETEE